MCSPFSAVLLLQAFDKVLASVVVWSISAVCLLTLVLMIRCGIEMFTK